MPASAAHDASPRPSRSQGANSTGFWLTELLSGAAGDSWTQEANYFLPETVVPLGGKRSLRRYHMVVVDSDEYVGRFIHPRAGRV